MTTAHNTPDSKQEALKPCPKCLDSLALTKWKDAEVSCGRCGFNAPFDAWQARASVAAVPSHALVQLLEAVLLHPESAEGNIRQVIETLNAVAAVEGDDDVELPPQPVMIQGIIERAGKARFALAQLLQVPAVWPSILNAVKSLVAASNPPRFVSEVDQWKHDLTEAGWVAETALNWRAPDGTLWRGPAGAWKELQRRNATAAPARPEGKECEYCACPEHYSVAVTFPYSEGRWHQSAIGGYYRCAATPPVTPSDAAMRAAEEIAPDLICPFCADTDFDAPGLKHHLTHGYCGAFEQVPTLDDAVTQRLRDATVDVLNCERTKR